MTVIFASLNVGLQRAQACGRNGEQRFKAIARGVQQAFEQVQVHVMGLIEVGDAILGLPAREAARLLQIIKDQMPDLELVVHADATDSPYILLSKAGSNVNLTNVRVVEGFVAQKWRKALRATLVEANGDMDLWLVNLASSKGRHLPITVRQEMLSHLATGKPTVVAGDLNTPEFMLRHWMQNDGAIFSPSLACSGATPALHGDYTIATNMFMWETEHKVGKSFTDANVPKVDCVSDAHDMVCVVLSYVTRSNPVTTDAAKLGGRPEEQASSSNDPITADAAELGDATPDMACPGEEASSAADPTTADAAELGAATDPLADLHLDSDRSSRLRDEAVGAVSQTQQALLSAAENSVNFSSSSDEERSRSRSASRRRASPSSESHSPSPSVFRSSVFVGDHQLPLDFLAAMQDLLWPVKFTERDRPADLLSFDSSLNPTVRMAPLEATISVATLILALRQVALDRRVVEAWKSGIRLVPNSNAPLTYKEVGWVLDFWKGKFKEQKLTQEQAEADWREGCNNKKMRKRMHGRWSTYMGRALGNRKLGMALITLGFDVDLNELARAYAKASDEGDASSLPSRELRHCALSMRSWFRWGRQLHNSVKSNKVTWESLGPTARNAWRWYDHGWSAQEADRLTREYGHGMLRAGPDRGSFLGQQATGSVVDRMITEFF